VQQSLKERERPGFDSSGSGPNVLGFYGSDDPGAVRESSACAPSSRFKKAKKQKKRKKEEKKKEAASEGVSRSCIFANYCECDSILRFLVR
jgi:hypothetical protein